MKWIIVIATMLVSCSKTDISKKDCSEKCKLNQIHFISDPNEYPDLFVQDFYCHCKTDKGWERP